MKITQKAQDIYTLHPTSWLCFNIKTSNNDAHKKCSLAVPVQFMSKNELVILCIMYLL